MAITLNCYPEIFLHGLLVADNKDATECARSSADQRIIYLYRHSKDRDGRSILWRGARFFAHCQHAGLDAIPLTK
eukprot:1161416-Pelagomonas_calceolata.AAC.1